MICGCRELQKTVGVADSLAVLLSNRPVAHCSVSVRLINVSDFSQLFDRVSIFLIQCHHMSLMDFVVSLAVVVEV
jgi:hypothetical protein